MKKTRHLLLFLAAGFIVSACNGVIVEDYPGTQWNYSEGDFDLATINGEIATIVIGNPFSEQSKKFADRVRALMKDQVTGFPISFVSWHGANTTKPYKVVVVFNPRQNVDNRTICRMEERTPMTASTPGRASLIMSFCNGDNLKSGTQGRVGNVKGENDPRFAALVEQVTDAMIPPVGLEDFMRRDQH